MTQPKWLTAVVVLVTAGAVVALVVVGYAVTPLVLVVLALVVLSRLRLGRRRREQSPVSPPTDSDSPR